MSGFKNWNDLVEDADAQSGLACYKLDVLLEIYGIDRASTQASADIIASLSRRGYGVHPENLTARGPETWVRLYKHDSFLGRVAHSFKTITPAANEDLLELLRPYEQNENIKALTALAKTII